jgi:NAD(P)-dependent dehydrogenase (short-subunit alcohol dehydrogenase family)
MNTQMAGKICIVTGATNGIGEVTAQALADRGATVIGVGRNPAKCVETANRIKAATGNQAVEYMVADLSVQAQVRKLAEVIKTKYPRIDVLVNNAGAFIATRQLSADGIEMTWALNHLNYFLLTNLLLDALKAAPAARIVNVSSGAHTGAREINFADPGFSTGYSGWQAYSHSKLANILFTVELARRLQGTHVTANALHPGFVATGFGSNNVGVMGFGLKIIQRIMALSPEKGAETNIYLASSPEVEGVTGKYFTDKHIAKSSPASQDVEVAKRLWTLSEEQTKFKQPVTAATAETA